MAYDRESYGERSRDRLGEESVGGEIEEEPNDLDQPEGLFDDDELEGEALEIDGEELEDDEDEDRASPLAEDAPPQRRGRSASKSGVRGPASRELEQEEPGYELASALQDEDDLEDSPGVRTSGGSDVAVMSQSDRRREFPSVAREARGPGKRKEGLRSGGRRGRRRKPARA